ncbi:MAG TPA: ABC transporter permease, partial [Candidatus Methylomirabilis sp.]|nr:ABC transporter permease [Candidatus Methylomirabilis sp.]
RLRLDSPLLTQYGSFLSGLVRGDLGTSFVTQEPVAGMILRTLRATGELAAAALAVALSLALPLGTVAAVFAGRPADRISMGAALLGLSVPNFVLGPLLILAFAIGTGTFPVSGREGAASVVLPALTLGLALAALLSRMTRASLAEVLTREFVTAARARGLPERRVILRHALRNAAIPILTILGLQAGALLSGAIITETIFSWPGLGRLTLYAIQTRDFPLVQGCVLTIAAIYVLVHLTTDCLYAWVDPRIRYDA